MGKPLRVGVLGAAGIARKNARAISKTVDPTVEVVAVASRTLDKAEAFVKEHAPHAKAVEGYDALVEDPGVDAVYIPLPTSKHLEWVEKCAAHGKHMLLEKPIALDNKTAETLVALCEKANVQFFEGTMWVHGPRAAKLREAIHETYREQLGRVRSVSSLFFFPAPEAFFKDNIRSSKDLDALGCLGDIGWYCVRYTLFAFDYDLPSSVQAHPGWRKNAAGVLVRVGASLLWEDGRQATFQCGFDLAGTQSMQILGERGAIRLTDFCIPYREDQHSFEVVYGDLLADLDTRIGTTTETVTVHLDRPQETHMWEAFARCAAATARGGGRPEGRWPREALLTQRVLCAVAASVDAGNALVSVGAKGGEQKAQ